MLLVAWLYIDLIPAWRRHYADLLLRAVVELFTVGDDHIHAAYLADNTCCS